MGHGKCDPLFISYRWNPVFEEKSRFPVSDQTPILHGTYQHGNVNAIQALLTQVVIPACFEVRNGNHVLLW